MTVRYHDVVANEKPCADDFEVTGNVVHLGEVGQRLHQVSNGTHSVPETVKNGFVDQVLLTSVKKAGGPPWRQARRQVTAADSSGALAKLQPRGRSVVQSSDSVLPRMSVLVVVNLPARAMTRT